VFLNGKPIFMRGISIHGEIPQEARRAVDADDARQLSKPGAKPGL